MTFIGYSSERAIYMGAKRRSGPHDLFGRFALVASMTFVAMIILVL